MRMANHPDKTIQDVHRLRHVPRLAAKQLLPISRRYNLEGIRLSVPYKIPEASITYQFFRSSPTRRFTQHDKKA